MNRFSTLFKGVMVAALCMLAVDSSQAAKKKILLEEFTGAWCQYCPDGQVQMLQILKDHPDDVIAVAIHDNDKMAIPEDAIYGPVWVKGYPAGMVQRHDFTGMDAGYNPPQKQGVAFNRTYWADSVTAQLAIPTSVAVSLERTYNSGTRELTVTVKANFEAAMSGDLRFNAYIIEDSVTGKGTGYDQVNAYNGVAGHPYYQKGNPVIGFYHRHVVRQMLGGAWGTESVIPATVKVGDSYSKTYTFTLPAGWDEGKITLVGLVQQYNTDATKREVLNSETGELFTTPSTTTVATGDPKLIAKPANDAGVANFTISNISSAEITYVATLTKSARTPADWAGTMSPAGTEFKVLAGKTVNIALSLKPGTTMGVGDLLLSLVEKGNTQSRTYGDKITVVSAEATKVSINGDGDDTYALTPIIKATGRDYLSISADEFLGVKGDLGSLKYISWEGGQKGEMSTEMATFLAYAINTNGVGVLISGQVGLALLSYAQNNHQLFGTIGVRPPTPADISGTSTFTMAGYSGDPITDKFQQACALINGGFWVQELQILDDAIATPILQMKSPARTLGARIELENARIVVLNFNPGIITNATARQSLIDKSLTWLEGPVTAKPKAALSVTKVDFGSVEKNKESIKSFDISAGNSAGLVVDAIGFFDQDGADQTGLSVAGTSKTLPATLAEGEKLTIQIKYAPKSVGQIDDIQHIEVHTNDASLSDGIAALEVAGEAVPATNSVPEVVSVTGDVRMSVVGQNPFVNNTTIHYAVSGLAKDTRLSVYNELGQEVAVLVNGNILPGAYSVAFVADKLPVGTYRVVLTTPGSSLSLSLVHVK